MRGQNVADRITKRLVDGLAPEATNVVVWDSEVKGFGVVCTPKGAKSYVLQYVVGSGRGAPKRRFTIGRHGSPWTPETARSEAKRLAGIVEAGGDPLAKRQADREVLTVSELCELYFAEGATHKKASTIKADKARVAHHIKPLLGRKRIDQLVRGDVERLMVAVTDGKTAVTVPKEERPAGSLARGGAGVAAQCVTLLGTLLAFAIRREMITRNVAHGVDKAKIRKIERFLSEQEIADLAEALRKEEEAAGNPYPAAAIRLLMLTGCRRSEIINLRWDQVNLEHRLLLLADSKTGKKSVYLSAPALALLDSLPKVKGNPHVIAGALKGSALSGIDKIWVRVRGAAGLDDVRLHDLRHSFASIGVLGGLSLPVLGKLLGHSKVTTTERYAHLSADPIRAANEAVGARIAAAMKSKLETGEVIDLKSTPRKKPRRRAAGA